MHLFIVSEETLPVHLKYGFAGVKKEDSCSWANVTVSGSSERPQAGIRGYVSRASWR